MPLTPGHRIGHYEILALAGAGGMGEVYRARDTVLKRDVALKVLPTALSRDPDRLGRFQREAEILASLNHPGIAIIHGMAAEGELRAIVMEFVEGETLRGPLPLDTVLNYARQIIDALEYAHDRGVIHRDLKPGNVKITAEGQVKLLDFGLAKAIEDPSPASNPADSPTLTLGHTRAGAILGTAAYMSPEQAVGKPADRRSDIFSFGSVVYEMLAGERAFHGDSGPEILVAVASAEPDWGKLPAETPEWLRALLRRCLVKDRKQRLQAIGEARLVLENPGAADAGQKPGGRLKARPHKWIAATALAIVVAGVGWWLALRPAPPPPRPVTRFATSITEGKGTNRLALPVLSRDGSRIALRTGDRGEIHVRMMDEFESKPIAGTGGGTGPPCFSPDGQWLAYATGAQLKKVPVAGGASLTLVDGLAGADFCHWGEDGFILFEPSPVLMRVPASGGKVETIATPDAKSGEVSYESPQLLPGGTHVLFSIVGARGLAEPQVAVLNLRTREKTILLEGAGLSRYAPSGPNPQTGHIVYARNGSLFAVPFDVNRLQAGSPAPVLEGVASRTSIGLFGFSDSGTLAYVGGEGAASAPLTLMWVDRQGKEEPLAAPARAYSLPRISPDGGRVAVPAVELQAYTADLWIHELARAGSLTRITFGGANTAPVWTPDGKRLIYASAPSMVGGAGGLSSAPADNSGPPTTLLASERPGYYPTGVSPDGKLLMGVRGRTTRGSAQDVWVLPLGDGSSGGAKPRNFLDSQFNERHAAFSPDGRWVAYTSDDTGRSEVYVVPYPGPGGKSQVSTDGGSAPRWNRNGRELFFRNGNKMMAVEVETSPAFQARTPKMLFEAEHAQSFDGSGQDYDVSPDGRRFVMLKQGVAPQAQAGEMRVVLNWFEELRRRVPPLK
jgi:serine/threonine-protein kinase